MRRASTLVLLALLGATAAADSAKGPGAALAKLEAITAPDSSASWDRRYAAYTKAKTALDAASREAGDAWSKQTAAGEAFKLAKAAFDAYSEKAREVAEDAAKQNKPLTAKQRQAVSKLEALYRSNLEKVPAASRKAFETAQTALDAQLKYLAIRPAVADALRRESVPLSGWLLGLFGALLLWGGMTVCILIAVKAS